MNPLRIFLTSVALLGFLVFAPAALARTVYVANTEDGVSAIDTGTNQAIEVPDGEKLIKAGPEPVAIAITPDGRRAYVASIEGGVSVIDTAANRAIEVPGGEKLIEVGGEPVALAITPDGRRAYVADFGGGVSVIDTATNQAIEVPDGEKLIEVGRRPRAIAITPDGSHAYVSDIDGGISVIDTATNQAIEVSDGNKRIAAGAEPVGIAITPDGRRAYVADFSGGVSVIDTATNQAIEVPDGNKEIRVGGRPVSVAITPDGKRAYVANELGGVSVIDTSANRAIEVPDGNKRIAAGQKPVSIAITPNGQRAYVVNEGGSVSVIDTTSDEAIEVPDGNKRIIAGIRPVGLAIVPDQAPAASFTTSATLIHGGESVAFNASASKDPDGPIASYAFSFGDGQEETSASATTSHLFTSPGVYTVALRTVDAEGCSSSEPLLFTGQTAYCNGSTSAQSTQQITVTAPPRPPKRKKDVSLGVKVTCLPSAGPKGCAFKLQAVSRKPTKHKKKTMAESAFATAKVAAGHSAIVELHLEPAFAARVASAKRLLVREMVVVKGKAMARYVKLRVIRQRLR